MKQKEFIYSERAVAFLDVLGFQNKLTEFENEAIEYKNNYVAHEEDEVQGDINGAILFSQKANDFIETFNSAISKLDTDKFTFYLFSDNICITVKNTDGEETLIELLLVISELYFEFVQKGYFLRGGIDYGLFIDKASIALGVPLATAYKMESYQAITPRILLSKNFIKQFEIYSNINETQYSSILVSSLIKHSCEMHYLNVFNHIFKVDDKEGFFEKYNQNITANLSLNKTNEVIFNKFKWLAIEFNSFIETYTDSLAYLDENFEPTDEYILTVEQLKVTYGQ